MGRLLAKLAVAAAAALVPGPAALAATGYDIDTIALQGAPAPGTADNFGEFLDVALDESGRVAFGAPLSSGVPNAGVWVDPGTGAELRVRNGHPAPAPQVGTYVFFGGFTRLDETGRVGFGGVLTGGIDGVFLDTAGTDSVLVAEGHAAPTPPSGTFAGGISNLGFFGMNAAGDISFRSNVTGGSVSSGVFVRTDGGALSMRVGTGDLTGVGEETFNSFGYPAINDAGFLAYESATGGGPASPVLVRDTGSGRDIIARAGDEAPGAAGGTLVDFLYPAIGAGAEVVFLSNVAGSSVTGGLFVASPALAPVVVENQSIPGAGPVSTLSSLPAVSDDGVITASLGFASGPVTGGVYVHSAGDFTPVALAGEVPPDTGGASLASFGFVSRNAAGQVAFVATLSDARKGVFLATPVLPPQIPMLPGAALPALFALLAVSARRARRRAR
jgi:hypothetical protein